MTPIKMYINGEWCESSDGKTFQTFDPATGALVGELYRATPEDVDRAVMAARAAFVSGVWSGLDGDERAVYMLKAAEIMKRRFDEFAELEARDSGKPISETTTVDMPYSVMAMEYFANAGREIRGETIPIPGHFAFDWYNYEPYGVVAAIAPWNFPLHLFTRAVCPALAAGNTVVAKGSSLTPMTAALMGEIFEEAGFPKGVINIVSGSGSVAGEALISHREVNMIGFTGSEEVGRHILEVVAKCPVIKKTILELGGKGAFVAHKDCNVDGAVNSLITGFCLEQGEVCCASTRLYLHADIYKTFLQKLTERLAKIKIGGTLDPETQMGSLIDQNQYEVVDGYVKRAVQDGAKLLYGGYRLTDPPYDKGWFYMPTVLEVPSNDLECVQREIFGPVLTVMKYTDVEEAIKLANGTDYGLGATFWSENPRLLYYASQKLDAGTVWLNTNVMSKMQAPYGGNKNSGVGREYGRMGLREYMKVKNTILFTKFDYDNQYGF